MDPEGRAGALDRAVPGWAALRRGRDGGLAVLCAWAGLLALGALRSGRVVATLRSGGPGEWTALVTLLAALAACWGWGTAGDLRAQAGRLLPERARRRALGDRTTVLALSLVAVLLLVALLAPYLAPYDPARQLNLAEGTLLPPSLSHPFGTDRLARDVLSRAVYGARVSLAVAVPAVAVAVSLGTAVGATAGYLGGWADSAAMRGVDLALSFPRIVLLVAAAALLRPSLGTVVLLLGLTGWMGVARLVRGEVLSVREREYVLAARTLGLPERRVLGRHVLPNAAGPVVVAATLGVGEAILAEAALSFLGLGIQPPTPSWGGMIAGARASLPGAWWLVLFPGLALSLTVAAFNLAGDGLREALAPRRPEVQA